MNMSLLIYYSAMLLAAWLSKKTTPCITKYEETGTHVLRRVLFVILSFLPVVLLLCFRENIGIDYQTYQIQFTRYGETPITRLLADQSSRELISVLYSKIAYILFGGVRGVFAAYAVATWILFYLAIKQYREDISVFFSSMVLIAIYFAESFNTVRQLLAVALIAYGFKFIRRGQPIKYTVVLIVASLIHNTAVVAIPLYFLCNGNGYNVRWKGFRKVITVLLLCIPFFISWLIDLLSHISVFTYYFDSYEVQQNSLSSTIVLKIPIWILFIIFYRKIDDDKQHIKAFYYLVLLDLVCYVGGMWFKWAFRLSYYSAFGEAILCGYIAKRSMKFVRPKYAVGIVITVYYLIMFWLKYFAWGWSGIFPYCSYL